MPDTALQDLREIEFDGLYKKTHCPVCKVHKNNGHTPDCLLASAIEKLEEMEKHPAMVWPETIRNEIAKTGHLLMGRVQGEGLAWSYEQLVAANSGLTAKLKASEDGGWIRVEDEPPRVKDFHNSEFYAVTDGEWWTIGCYNFPNKRWSKSNPPHDLQMGPVTHWKPVQLPK